MSVFAGTIPTGFLAGAKLRGIDEKTLADALTALTGPWNEFPGVAWTGSVSNPAIGNGTITAHYIQVGAFVVYKGAIVMGSTTTFGSGHFIISMPVAATLGNRNTGVVTLNDNSTSTNDRAGAVELLSSTTFRIVANGQVAATVPITFATSDALRWLVVSEAA